MISSSFCLVLGSKCDNVGVVQDILCSTLGCNSPLPNAGNRDSSNSQSLRLALTVSLIWGSRYLFFKESQILHRFLDGGEVPFLLFKKVLWGYIPHNQMSSNEIYLVGYHMQIALESTSVTQRGVDRLVQ